MNHTLQSPAPHCGYHVSVEMHAQTERFRGWYGGSTEKINRTLWRCPVPKCPFCRCEDTLAVRSMRRNTNMDRTVPW